MDLRLISLVVILSVFLIGVLEATTWQSKESHRNEGYDLQRGPVFYEAYYPDDEGSPSKETENPPEKSHQVDLPTNRRQGQTVNNLQEQFHSGLPKENFGVNQQRTGHIPLREKFHSGMAARKLEGYLDDLVADIKENPFSSDEFWYSSSPRDKKLDEYLKWLLSTTKEEAPGAPPMENEGPLDGESPQNELLDFVSAILEKEMPDSLENARRTDFLSRKNFQDKELYEFMKSLVQLITGEGTPGWSDNHDDYRRAFPGSNLEGRSDWLRSVGGIEKRPEAVMDRKLNEYLNFLMSSVKEEALAILRERELGGALDDEVESREKNVEDYLEWLMARGKEGSLRIRRRRLVDEALDKALGKLAVGKEGNARTSRRQRFVPSPKVLEKAQVAGMRGSERSSTQPEPRGALSNDYQDVRGSYSQMEQAENIFQPRPQVISYVFSPVKSRTGASKERTGSEASEKREGAKEQSSGGRSVNTIETGRPRAKDGPGIASIEVSEIKTRHKIRHHHGEHPRRFHQHHPAFNSTAKPQN